MVRTMLSLAALLSLSATAQAQPVHRAHELREDRRERTEDKREIAKDERERTDDLRDLKALEVLAADYDLARARRDPAGLQRVDDRLRRLVKSELKESQRELRDDQREVRRSANEVRDERREVRHDEREGRHAAAAADRRDVKDDKRDLRDDVRDAQKERAALDRYQGMLRELDSLFGRMDPPAVERKRAILGELIARARGELHEDAKEIREDKRELREDRHETREDRHERH